MESAPNRPAIASAAFTPKAISLLSAESPFFDAFWPVIFEVSDMETQNTLKFTSRYFREMAKRAAARRTSDRLKQEHIQELKEGRTQWDNFTNGLRLDPYSELPLWYSWGADKAGFGSSANFEEFCRVANVDPAQGHALYWGGSPFYPPGMFSFPPNWSFLSSEGDISFVCSKDPRDPERDGNVHYFGCTGEREKALKLEAWFTKHGDWSEICHASRLFI